MCFVPKPGLLEQCMAACANPDDKNCGNCAKWDWDKAICLFNEKGEGNNE